MNLRQLRYFAKVVEIRNMTRAAGELHIAQPALGMQIRQLEEDLGVALLVRHSRGVDPTPAGKLLHERAVEIFTLVESARREVTAAAGNEAESIRMGLTPALMLLLGAELAVAARDRLPHVFLSLSEGMSHVLAETLLRGDIDVALGYDMPESPSMECEALLAEDLVFVTLPSPDLGESIPFCAVVEEPLVLPEVGDSVRKRVVDAAQLLGVTPAIAFEVRSVPALKRLILRGAGAGVLPYASILEEVRTGQLAARRITAPALRRTLHLVVRAGAPPLRNAVALRALVRESLDELVRTLGPLAHPAPAFPRQKNRLGET